MKLEKLKWKIKQKQLKKPLQLILKDLKDQKFISKMIFVIPTTLFQFHKK